MRYVFVDIDELIGYDEKSEEEAISKNVLKMLKKIIQKTSCRLVITSKWRREFWTEKYDLIIADEFHYLLDDAEFNKYQYQPKFQKS